MNWHWIDVPHKRDCVTQAQPNTMRKLLTQCGRLVWLQDGSRHAVNQKVSKYDLEQQTYKSSLLETGVGSFATLPNSEMKSMLPNTSVSTG